MAESILRGNPQATTDSNPETVTARLKRKPRSPKTVRTVTLEECRSIQYDPITGFFIRKSTGKLTGWLNPRRGYITVMVAGKQFYAHRLAWFMVHGHWDFDQIDHINGVTSDNRIVNLRPSTQSQNGRNRGKPSCNTSGYKGICLDKRDGRWIAQIMLYKRSIYLGRFDKAADAAAAYDRAALDIHGKFARLNEL